MSIVADPFFCVVANAQERNSFLLLNLPLNALIIGGKPKNAIFIVRLTL